MSLIKRGTLNSIQCLIQMEKWRKGLEKVDAAEAAVSS